MSTQLNKAEPMLGDVRGMYSLQSFEAIGQMASKFAASRIYGNVTPEQAFVILQAGLDLGISPSAAMGGIHVIQGKATMSGQLMLALVQKAGHRFEVLESTEKQAHVRITRTNGVTHEATFNLEDAKRAGLLGKDTWSKWPRQMVLNRAISECARYCCPEALSGIVYTPEDFDAVVTDGQLHETASPVPALHALEDKTPEPWTDEDRSVLDELLHTMENLCAWIQEPEKYLPFESNVLAKVKTDPPSKVLPWLRTLVQAAETKAKAKMSQAEVES